MKRTTSTAAAAALGLGLMAGAQAQSGVSVYGLMDMSAGRFQGPGAAKVWRADSGLMSTPFLGIKGSEDLSGGVRANFAIEHALRLDAGAIGRFDGEAFWGRNAYFSLQGEFGQTRLGRNATPLFATTSLFNPFGDSFGFSPAIRHHFLGAIAADTVWNNSMAYTSPASDGLSVNLMANLSEGAGRGKNLGASALYWVGPFGAGVAWQRVKNGVLAAPAGFAKQNAFQVAGSYDLGVVKLFAQVGALKSDATADVKTRLLQFGVSAPLGGGRLLASYGNARTSQPVILTRQTLSVGYDHPLSKSTDVYGVLMNDKATGLAAGNTLAAGLRVRF